jgi:hypothetical protein
MSPKKGGTLRKWPNALTRNGITSVTWRGRIIDTTMMVFYPPEGLELINDQVKFVTDKLS